MFFTFISNYNKWIALAGKMNIGKSNADGNAINSKVNARNEIMPPAISHFHAIANPNRPIPKRINPSIAYLVIGSEVPLLLLSIVSPIKMINANTTIIALKIRAINLGIFILIDGTFCILFEI